MNTDLQKLTCATFFFIFSFFCAVAPGCLADMRLPLNLALNVADSRYRIYSLRLFKFAKFNDYGD